jgi:hypothetical protein
MKQTREEVQYDKVTASMRRIYDFPMMVNGRYGFIFEFCVLLSRIVDYQFLDRLEILGWVP